MDKKEVRALFSKTGRAVYISHLDLVRTMQRALKRSGIPVWYSEGFNPRVYMNFPLALSLGIAGRCEPMDFYVTGEISYEETAYRLNSVLPEGIRILKVYQPVNINKEITAAEYFLRVRCSGADTAGILGEFFGAETLVIQKHTKKRGIVPVDIKQFCEVWDISGCGDGSASFFMRLPAGNDMNINAGTVTDSFIGYCSSKEISAEVICIERTKILCSELKEFV